MSKHERFAQRLRDLRQAADMTQQQLADKADVPVWSLRNWEGGRRMPSLGAAFALAQALGVPLERLAEVAEVWERTPPAKATLKTKPKGVAVKTTPQKPASTKKRTPRKKAEE